MGEALQLHNGTTVVIKQIETGIRVEKVYNLTVANTHNYFVGEDGVLVHNCKGTLTDKELQELQEIADQFNTQIDVIGSRASGEGRNINTDLPVGKGDGTRSDIDVRIDGQVDIDTRGGLSDAIKKVGKGAGSVTSSTGGMIPSDPPVIIIKPRKPR